MENYLSAPPVPVHEMKALKASNMWQTCNTCIYQIFENQNKMQERNKKNRTLLEFTNNLDRTLRMHTKKGGGLRFVISSETKIPGQSF